MRIVVMDTETTGMDELDQVIELAAIDLVEPYGKDPSEVATYYETERTHMTVQPTVPIHVAARATHHITDDELIHGDTIDKFVWNLVQLLTDDKETVWAFHNAEFDMRLIRQTIAASDGPEPIPFLPERHICTYICGKHLYPDAPGHSNQVLRYYLGLDAIYGSLTIPNAPPHRATSDALVTSRLLMHMLRTNSPEHLIELTQTPVLVRDCRMPKHAGKTWEEVCRVDRAYCSWILGQGVKRKLPDGQEVGFDADMIHTIKFHLGLL